MIVHLISLTKSFFVISMNRLSPSLEESMLDWQISNNKISHNFDVNSLMTTNVYQQRTNSHKNTERILIGIANTRATSEYYHWRNAWYETEKRCDAWKMYSHRKLNSKPYSAITADFLCYAVHALYDWMNGIWWLTQQPTQALLSQSGHISFRCQISPIRMRLTFHTFFFSER